MKHYFTYKDDKSDKFWHIEVKGKSFTVMYGKTGTAGTSQTKSFASQEQCKKEAEKLLNEKLKKGYQAVEEEGKQDYREIWKKIAAAKDVKQAFYNHFSVFVETDAEKEILKTLSGVIEGAKIEKDLLVFRFKSKYDEKRARYCSLYCKSPYGGKPGKGVPLSFLQASRLHNGIHYESLGGGYVGFFGINAEGTINQCSYEPEYLEDGDDDDLLEKLEEKDMSVNDVIGVMDYKQNWILFDPFRKTTHREPAYLFMSHGGGSTEPIKKAKSMKFGAFLLAVLCTSITEETVLDAISG
jgi:predicted DNA-binding WGR domain protein